MTPASCVEHEHNPEHLVFLILIIPKQQQKNKQESCLLLSHDGVCLSAEVSLKSLHGLEEEKNSVISQAKETNVLCSLEDFWGNFCVCVCVMFFFFKRKTR